MYGAGLYAGEERHCRESSLLYTGALTSGKGLSSSITSGLNPSTAHVFRRVGAEPVTSRPRMDPCPLCLTQSPVPGTRTNRPCAIQVLNRF